MPPLAWISCPVIQPPCGEMRRATTSAMSTASPVRPSVVRAVAQARQRGLGHKEGARTFTAKCPSNSAASVSARLAIVPIPALFDEDVEARKPVSSPAPVYHQRLKIPYRRAWGLSGRSSLY